MSLSSWISWPILALRSHARGAASAQPLRQRSKKARFSLEPLEARGAAIPSYTASSPAALIADITAANTSGGANTITLTAATTAPYVLTARHE